MKNSMLPESELKILGEIFEKTEELVKNHEKTHLTMEMVEKASETEQVHIVMYMDLIKEYLTALNTLKGLLEVSEEEFLKAVTEDGKLPLKEVKRQLMINMIVEML